MTNSFDNIFRNSQHSKSLKIRKELWDKVERRLNDDRRKPGILRPWMIAASLIIIFSLSFLLFSNSESYELEDMVFDVEPHFSKEEVADLDKYYEVDYKISVNPDLG